MVDTRTTAERERDRKEAAKRAEQFAQDEKSRKELAVREANKLVQMETAEADKLKAQAVIKYSEALKLNEENKKLILEVQREVLKDEYQYQKTLRDTQANLANTNWIEQQRHERQLQIEGIKKDIAHIAAEAQKVEAYASADEIQGLLSALNQLK